LTLRDRDHPLLPLSFPTRRSSDLAHLALQLLQRELEDVLFPFRVPRRFQLADRRIREALKKIRVRFTSGTHRTSFERRLFTQVIDRKSTRLNSSHVSISYAAFCLK